MKYQDLCIKLSEVLRAKGINTIYFDDVNLLNSEDVIYPAAVAQLVRVEQENHSDRYTIMLTIARETSCCYRQHDNEEYSVDLQVNNPDRAFIRGNISYPRGYIAYYDFRWVVGPYARPTNLIAVTLLGKEDVMAVLPYYDVRYIAIAQPGMYVNRRLPFPSNAKTFAAALQYKTESMTDHEFVQNIIDSDATLRLHYTAAPYDMCSPSILSVRGITEILAEDEHIQINSCVTTPFKWKFRDEVEGITAEINLSLFFDSNCN